MFDIDLQTLDRDVPVNWRKTTALLHYDKSEGALYILHNRVAAFDGSKPKDFHKFSTEYKYSWWLKSDNGNYDSFLTRIVDYLEIRDDNIGRL